VNQHGLVGSMRGLANKMQRRFPQLPCGQHMRDAAGAMDRGQHASATRHLHAAIGSLAPLQLSRAGIHDDAGFVDAKAAMHEAHRHLLLVKDHQEEAGKVMAQ
jgi:hypothetical protein